MNNTCSLPKGPGRKNLFQMLKFFRYPISIFEENRAHYGNTFTLRFSGLPAMVIISDPSDLKQVFSENSNELPAGEMNATLLQPILGDNALLCLDGEKHLRHRKLLLPPFHGQRMKFYGELISRIVKNKLSSWKKGDNLKLVEEAREMTFSIILGAVFGMDEKNTRIASLTKSLHALISVLSKPYALITLLNPALHRHLGPLTPWTKMMNFRNQVDACLFTEIAERKKQNLDSRMDILSLLLQAKDEAGNGMTDQEIRDEMLTMLMAGHDTSTMGIAWAFYGILKNPSVLKKLKEELDFHITSESELIKNLDNLVYLDAVIREALRITPVLPYVNRITKGTYQLGEYSLPKGTLIAPCLYLTHHDRENWLNPEQFVPERFLNYTEKPYSYLPFGGGIRRCIGSAFAHYQMKIIIAEILLHGELELKQGYTTKLERKGVVISPSQGLPVMVK